jgi:hypothetical protein
MSPSAGRGVRSLAGPATVERTLRVRGSPLKYTGVQPSRVAASRATITPAMKFGAPHELVRRDLGDDDVASDGKEFLMLKPQPTPPVTQIDWVLNWTEELKKALATNWGQ